MSELLRKLEEQYSRALADQDRIRLAIRAEKERMAQAGEGAPFPVGSIVCRWNLFTLVRGASMQAVFKPSLSKEKGIVEAVTHESWRTFAGNRQRPAVGSYVVRLLKKDGKPGKAYITLANYNIGDWALEGETPRNPKEAPDAR
jgi:hypothetical protein